AVAGQSRSPQRGIALAAALLTDAFRGGRAELAVQAGGGSKSYLLTLNGKAMLLASPLEGKAWGASPHDLANAWRQKIRDALAAMPEAQIVPAAAGAPAERDVVLVPKVEQDSALLEDGTRAATQPQPAVQQRVPA